MVALATTLIHLLWGNNNHLSDKNLTKSYHLDQLTWPLFTLASCHYILASVVYLLCMFFFIPIPGNKATRLLMTFIPTVPGVYSSSVDLGVFLLVQKYTSYQALS